MAVVRAQFCAAGCGAEGELMLVDFPKLDGKIGKHMLMRGNKICLSADEFIKMPQSEIFFAEFQWFMLT